MLYPNPIELDLPPDLSAPRVARVALAVLQPTDEAQLVVGELVTNAVLHGAPPIRLCAIPLGTRLIVEVRDARPDLGPPAPDSRGLRVPAVGRYWPISRSPGRICTFVVAAPTILSRRFIRNEIR